MAFLSEVTCTEQSKRVVVGLYLPSSRNGIRFSPENVTPLKHIHILPLAPANTKPSSGVPGVCVAANDADGDTKGDTLLDADVDDDDDDDGDALGVTVAEEVSEPIPVQILVRNMSGVTP